MTTNEELAKAWDEGLAAIAVSMLKPIGPSGLREAPVNPYRAQLPGEGEKE